MPRPIFLLLLLVLLTSTNSRSQSTLDDQDQEYNQLKAMNRSNIELGLMAGLNGSMFQFEPQLQDPNARIGVGQLTEGFVKWGGNTGSAYKASVGYLRKSNELFVPRQDSSFTLSYNLHSLSIPIEYVYQNDYNYISGKVFQQFFFGGGMGFNFHSKATREVKIKGLDFSQTNQITNQVKNIEVSLVFTAGTRFIVSKTGSVYLAFRGSNGLTNINENMDLFTNPGGQISSISINQVTFSVLLGISTNLAPSRKKANEDQSGPF